MAVRGLSLVAVNGFCSLLQARASHCRGVYFCTAQALGMWASVAVARGLQQPWLMGSTERAQKLWPMGLVAPRHMEPSLTRDRTPVPCTGWRTLVHRATKEVQGSPLTGAE